MSKASLAAIVQFCDRQLRTATFGDYDGAVNGLQAENSGVVTRIAATVDASLTTARLAASAGADLLIVHHGLFWANSHPWTGKRYELLRCLFESNLAIYSSHLPLDAHSRWGNNARLCAELGLARLQPFFFDHGQFIGLRSTGKMGREALLERVANATGSRLLLIPAGPSICRKIGVVTGGAGGELKKAADEGVDTFITGEGPHWSYALAEEFGINVIYAGHYATETFGVKALAAALSQKFKVPWSFIDHPTGL